jgi:AmmeMemoRadiSam system protein B/AmmeMemoRadiSam system protein A
MTIKKWGIILFITLVFFSFCPSQEVKTRDYLTTGGWYPRSAEQLNEMLDDYFAQAKGKKIPGKIVGIIGPHAGYFYSGLCAANAYKQLQNPSQVGPIERVILLGVSHGSSFYGAAVSTFDYNSTPLGKIPVDTGITKKLAGEKFFKVSNSVLQQEHSIENHLPFLQKALKNKKFKIIPILFGYLEKNDFKPIAAIIKKYIDEKTLVIASTDLTHYGAPFGYAPFKKDVKSSLTKLDMGIINHIIRLDFDSYYAYRQETGITMCGFIPVGVLIEIYADKNHTATLVDYYKSGDRNNDYSQSVSYASIIISKSKNKGGQNVMKLPLTLNKVEQKVLLSIARDTLEEYLSNGIQPGDLDKKYKISENLKETTGVFVTLKKSGHLRGCIGTIVGTAPLYLGVQDNAIKSAVKDYRFPPVKKEDLKEIDIEISVMTPLQRIDDYKKIRLGTDGVIIKKGNYQAVFLPQVATETGWNLDQFLSRLCQKAGLPARSYSESENMEFYIFQAQVFGEK